MKNFISIILIVLALALGFFYIRPQYAVMSDLQATKANYDDALSKANQVKTLRDSLEQSYNNISDTDKTKLQKMIPPVFDPVKLTADMNNVAASNGMTVRSVTVNTLTDDASRANVATSLPVNPYKTTVVAFTVSGQYPSFIRFLRGIESNIELSDVTGLVVVPSRVYTGAFDFQVTLHTYSVN